MSGLFFDQSPVRAGENSSKSWSLKLRDFYGESITLSSTITTYAYKNGSGSNIVSDLDTGSASVSGDTLTTETFSGWAGGNYYILSWYCKVNGVQDLVGKLRVDVENDEE